MPEVRLVVGLLVLAGLLSSAAWTWYRRSTAGAWTLLVFSALWFATDQRLEGPVLAVYSATHGLTLADLLSPLGAIVAVAVLLPQAWRRAPGDGRVWSVLTVLGGCWTVLALGMLLAVSYP